MFVKTSRSSLKSAPKSKSLGGPPSSRDSPSLDPRLVEALTETFEAQAGSDRGDRGIDVEDFQRALKIRSDFLAHRMFAILDRDGNGRVSREEFLEAVRRLVFGSTRQKLRLAFQLHDLDGNGRIEPAEIERMISLGLAEEAGSEASGIRSRRQRQSKAEQLASLFLLTADQDGDGSLSYAEFERIASSDERLLRLLSECEAARLAPDTELLKKPRSLQPWSERLRRWLDNHLAWVAFLSIWGLANAALAIHGAWSNRAGGPYFMLAHATGATMNLNGALILLTVMRGLLTKVRGSVIGRLLPLDDTLKLHRLLGHSLLTAGVVHSVAHGLNYSAGVGLPHALQTSRAAQTGVGLLLIMLVMWVFSLPPIRKSGRFELFYFVHFAYVGWFALALFHARHLPMWLSLPLALFVLESGLRYRRRSAVAPVVELSGLPSGVSCVTLAKPADFRQRAGDYAFLKIPALAAHEWHPFTISSAPEREHLTFHVRSEGNWTSALRHVCDTWQPEQPLSVHIDGPYGAPSAHVFSTRHAVLIGAGIGVTPFASVLDSIVHRANAGDSVLEKVHFYWLSRESRAFEWFADRLLELEQRDQQQLVDINICMTGGRGNIAALALNLARDLSHDIGKPDLVTGLRTQTRLSAPDFESELGQIAERYAPEPVEVFYCGPPSLGRKLRGICARLGLRLREEAF